MCRGAWDWLSRAGAGCKGGCLLMYCETHSTCITPIRCISRSGCGCKGFEGSESSKVLLWRYFCFGTSVLAVEDAALLMEPAI